MSAVGQPDAAVRDPTGQQLGLVRAVDADEAAAGPVGQPRARAEPEGQGPVARAGVAGQPVAHVEAARRRGRRAPADADPRPQQLAAGADVAERQALPVHDQAGPREPARAEGVALDPAGLARGQPGDAGLHPRPPVLVHGAPEGQHDVVRALRGEPAQQRDAARLGRGAHPRLRVARQGRPAGGGDGGAQAAGRRHGEARPRRVGYPTDRRRRRRVAGRGGDRRDRRHDDPQAAGRDRAPEDREHQAGALQHGRGPRSARERGRTIGRRGEGLEGRRSAQEGVAAGCRRDEPSPGRRAPPGHLRHPPFASPCRKATSSQRICASAYCTIDRVVSAASPPIGGARRTKTRRPAAICSRPSGAPEPREVG